MNRKLAQYGARPVNAQAERGMGKLSRKKRAKAALRKPATSERAVDRARRALERAAWERKR